MSITITIVDPTPEQIAALFSSVPMGVTEDKPATRKKAELVRAKAEEPDAEAEAETDTGDVPSLDDVKAAAQKLVNASSRDALAELLETFASKNLSSVPEAKRAAFIEQCENKAK